jgi:hypothetical protein
MTLSTFDGSLMGASDVDADCSWRGNGSALYAFTSASSQAPTTRGTAALPSSQDAISFSV